ncbi:MAG: aminotransferase [Candidatus Marinimicrobia bacterium]|nr:aminotransferase [Candidatus Neomarinimicrobiota bacterium]
MIQTPKSTSTMKDQDIAPWPVYDSDEVDAATYVLKSGHVNYWTGNEGRKFEIEYAKYCGVAHGLVVTNGTAALELALYGLGIGVGDEVVVPARTFIATAAAVALCGAQPVVADIDPISQNLTAETVAKVLSPQTKAVIPVHLAGWPVDMKPIMNLARQQSIMVVEDCAQAHGATIDGRPVGSFGHIGCFSFCQDKIISTGGEGGMIVTNDNAIYQRMWSHRDHGKDFDRSQAPEASPGFKWLATTFGTNWRLTEFQSAIGRIQLKKLPQWTATRRNNAAQLDSALSSLRAVSIPTPPSNLGHAYYKYSGLINTGELKDGWSRDQICAELNSRGVPARVGACPDISREAAFTADTTSQPTHPNAESLADRTFTLPVYPSLSENNISFIANTTRDIILKATR